LFSPAKRIYNFGKEIFMKNKNTDSGSFAVAKFQTNSRRLLVIALVAAIGLSMAACQDEPTDNGPIGGEKGPNLFLGEWEGTVISSAYEEVGEVPVELTITEDAWILEVMGQSGEGTYTWNSNVMTILYWDEPMGTATLNAAGNLEVVIVDEEGFGNVSGTLRRKTSEPPVPMDVTVVFENVKDAEIIMNDFVLDEDDVVEVTVGETFAAYAWYINGVPADNALISNGGKTITLSGNGDYLNQGNNRLSVKVTTGDGVIYSKIVIFTVE
jgi:hypothetical protein